MSISTQTTSSNPIFTLLNCQSLPGESSSDEDRMQTLVSKISSKIFNSLTKGNGPTRSFHDVLFQKKPCNALTINKNGVLEISKETVRFLFPDETLDFLEQFSSLKIKPSTNESNPSTTEIESEQENTTFSQTDLIGLSTHDINIFNEWISCSHKDEFVQSLDFITTLKLYTFLNMYSSPHASCFKQHAIRLLQEGCWEANCLELYFNRVVNQNEPQIPNSPITRLACTFIDLITEEGDEFV